MKTTKYQGVIAFTLLLFSLSCIGDSGQEEPTQWYHIFQLVDKDGRDFLSTRPDYDADKIQAILQIQNLYNLNTFEFKINQIGEKTYLSLFNVLANHNRMIYLDFGNGDTDTLNFSSRPEEIPNPFWTNIREFNFFYNGRKVHSYDLSERQNALWTRLLSHNMPNLPDKENKWVVITITKEERDSD